LATQIGHPERDDRRDCDAARLGDAVQHAFVGRDPNSGKRGRLQREDQRQRAVPALENRIRKCATPWKRIT
jgi:hypothetical protein